MFAVKYFLFVFFCILFLKDQRFFHFLLPTVLSPSYPQLFYTSTCIKHFFLPFLCILLAFLYFSRLSWIFLYFHVFIVSSKFLLILVYIVGLNILAFCLSYISYLDLACLQSTSKTRFCSFIDPKRSTVVHYLPDVLTHVVMLVPTWRGEAIANYDSVVEGEKIVQTAISTCAC